jgi:hypothetical protein
METDLEIPLAVTDRRPFTPAEANEILPVLRTHLDVLTESLQRAAAVSGLLEEARDATSRFAAMEDLEELQQAARQAMTEIERLGAVVRSVSPGILEFGAFNNGQSVMLCWHESDPPRVLYWRHIYARLEHRQRLDLTCMAAWEYCC